MPRRASTVLPTPPVSPLRTSLGLGLLALMLACRTAAPAVTSPSEPSRSLEARLEALGTCLQGEEQLRTLESLTRELEAGVSREPRDAHLRFLLGRAYFYAGRAPEAGRAFDEALALAPEVAEYHHFKGFYLRFQKDLDGSLAALTRAIELEPQKARSWSQLGITLELKKELPRALEAYERALALDPANAPALTGSGLVLLALGDEQKALLRLDEAARRSPGDPLLRDKLGQLFQSRGDHPRALAYFQEASALAPDDWRLRASLIQEHQALGQTEERDAQLAALRDLRRRGQVDSPFFVREQFTEAGETVRVFESFELEGERAVRYRFDVLNAEGTDAKRTLSLGSDPDTPGVLSRAGSVPPGGRRFHLGGAFPDGSRQTFARFDGEPSYEDTRALVMEVLHGRLQPTSESRATRP